MAQPGLTGYRRALRRLRRVMVGEGSAQERLDQLVRIIAADMVAEVCSVYVMRAGEVLELFASEGLNPVAIHQTRLRVGQGLVGNVAATARSLNLADAQSHPQFLYRPETGEESYRSFLGVPVIRGGRVSGVLVIQNRTQRQYTDDETEALELIAVIIAELIASGRVVSPEERLPVTGNTTRPVRLTGVPINPGVAIGVSVLHQPRISIPNLFADDAEAEHARLAEAIASMHSALDDLIDMPELADGGEHRDILHAYRLIARDQGWLRRIREAIDTGLTAEAGVQKVRDDTRVRMRQISDPYLRERLYDLEDLANRLLQHLSGASTSAAFADLPDDVVLIARAMGPAELLDYDPARLRGLLLEEGSAQSHVAIVARALDIPVIGSVDDVLDHIDPHDPIVVDADNGQVFVRPGDDVMQMAAENLQSRAQRRAAYAALRDEPAVTKDGVRVMLNINAALLIDLHYLRDAGADGIGLYRTEIPFMLRAEYPNVDAQTELYRNVLDQAAGKPVRFRTLDIGGDKQLPYFREIVDQNPAMGWRAIRVALDRPGMLRQQLRALIRAARARELEIMFPMIAEVAELDAAVRILDLEVERERQRGGGLPKSIRIGAMLEVPGLLWQLDALLPKVDFLAVGSNDLVQFLFASDRANPRVADRYDVLSPGLLTLLRSLVRKCDDAGVPLSLCGEMAGRPLEAMALAGVGFRDISMAPASLGPIKTMIRSLSAGSLGAYLETLYKLPDHSLREKLRAFSKDHGVAISDT